MGNELGHDNFKYGHQGFMSLLDDAGQQDLMRIWKKADWKNSVGFEYVKKATGINPSRKTVYNLKQKLKDKYENSDDEPEREVDWTDFKSIEAYSNIPLTGATQPPRYHALMHELYTMWGEVRHATSLHGFRPIPFTYRILKWLSFMQVYHSVSIKETADKIAIAHTYATREMLADWTDTDIQRDDLDAWLFYKPWVGDEAMELYESLIAKGSIPALETTKFTSHASDLATQLPNLGVQVLEKIDNLNLLEKILETMGAKKYELPSMRLNNEDVLPFLEYMEWEENKEG